MNKNVTDVWGNITAQDVLFAAPTEHPEIEEEFMTMEIWAGWAHPGGIVGLVEPEQYWIESGEIWTPGVGNGAECNYFVASKGIIGTTELVKTPVEHFGDEPPCQKTQGAFFRFTSGVEPCVYWGATLAWCSPSPGYLPPQQFTLLLGGTEIATHNEPVAEEGRIEAYSNGGRGEQWKGNYTSVVWMTRQNKGSHGTCGEPQGWPGSIRFSAGVDCPLRHEEEESGEKGIFWEEPLFLTKRAMQTAGGADEESSKEAGGSGEPPQSKVDAYANYSQKGAPNRSLAEANAHKEAESEGVKPSEAEFESRSTTYKTTGLPMRMVRKGSSPGQEAFLNSKTVVVEMESKPTEVCGPDCENGGPWFLQMKSIMDPWFSEEPACRCFRNVILVYDATTGKLIERETLYEETAGQKKRKLHRWINTYKAEQEAKGRWKGWIALAKRKMKEGKPHEEGGAGIAEQWLEWQAEIKAEEKETKKRLKQEAKERKAKEREEKKAKAAWVSVLPKFNPERDVLYRELTLVAPSNRAVIAVKHNGNVLHVHHGKHYTVALREGMNYTVIAKGPGYRCEKHIRAGVHERIIVCGN